jgi:aspartyl protease family protein
MNRLIFTTFGAMLAMTLIAAVFSSIKPQAGAVATPEIHASVKPRGFSEDVVVSDQTILERDEAGRFHIPASLNGTTMSFLVDTGADTVVLTEKTAEQAGVRIPADGFQPIIRGASGTSNGAVVRIDAFEVAGRRFEDVDAIVAQGLETNLLGQSLLRKLGSVEIRGEKMVIGGD